LGRFSWGKVLKIAVWESGKTDIPIGKLKQLADVLGVSLAHLLGLEITSSSEDNIEVMRLQKDIEQLKRVIEDKDDLINRLRNEEQRFSTAIDKLLSALHTAYQNWYLDLPAGKPTLEKVGKQNLVFWT
jgi:transcriptional regulator with XRE-family HTH domain